MKRSGQIKRKVPLRANGGKARAERLPPERRKEIARAGGMALQAKRIASRQASAVHVKPNAVMASNLGAEPPRQLLKAETFRSEAWLSAVRSIPCVHCGGAVQAAHRNEGKGMGQKVDDCLTAALCPPEHSRIDQGRDMTREQRRAEIDRYIVLTLLELVRSGRVVVVAESERRQKGLV